MPSFGIKFEPDQITLIRNIPKNSKIHGAILSDQIKSLNWQIRNAKFISKLSDEIMLEVIEKIQMIISYQQ